MAAYNSVLNDSMKFLVTVIVCWRATSTRFN